MITTESIADARAKITAEFLRAVQGPPSMRVEEVDSEAAALGQHLRSITSQRGLHGTAAAIQVLAEAQTPEAQAYTRRLVHYVDQQHRIERAFDPPDIYPDALELSQKNIIKLSEILYALASVPTSLAPREHLAERIAKVLLANRGIDGGWPYFVGNDDKQHLLPTAHAVRALASHGYEYDLRASVEFLRGQLKTQGTDQTDIFVRVFALYVLCYLPSHPISGKDLKPLFDDAWVRLSPLLNQDLEANIEYVAGKSAYVRVPWQLYLLAVAAALSPYRRFANSKAQKRLRSIQASVATQGGLIYPHSGRDLSSRTNAILFDVLNKINDQLQLRRLPLRPFVLLERIKTFIASRAFQYTIRAMILLLIVYAVTNWLRSSTHHLSDLAPELVSSVLLILLTGKRET